MPQDLTVQLFSYEIEHLIEWHREEMFKASEKMNYAEAGDHQRRAGDLRRMVDKPSSSALPPSP